MDPFTAMLIVAGVGYVVDYFGKKKEGDAAERQAKIAQQVAESEAQLSDYNAAVADLQATDAIARGAAEESKFRSGVRSLIGSVRAGFGAAGVDTGFGSAADVQTDATYLGELDALTITNNAAREAWGFKVEAADLRTRSTILRQGGAYALQAGQEAQKATKWGQASSLIGVGTSLLAMKYGYGDKKSLSVRGA